MPRGISVPQTEEQKIRSRLRSYERKLQKEKKEYGFYRDGAGNSGHRLAATPENTGHQPPLTGC